MKPPWNRGDPGGVHARRGRGHQGHSWQVRGVRPPPDPNRPSGPPGCASRSAVTPARATKCTTRCSARRLTAWARRVLPRPPDPLGPGAEDRDLERLGRVLGLLVRPQPPRPAGRCWRRCAGHRRAAPTGHAAGRRRSPGRGRPPATAGSARWLPGRAGQPSTAGGSPGRRAVHPASTPAPTGGRPAPCTWGRAGTAAGPGRAGT